MHSTRLRGPCAHTEQATSLLLQIDLLVVGRRGQGLCATIRNLTGLGSVSSHLTSSARCPLIVTRPEEPQR